MSNQRPKKQIAVCTLDRKEQQQYNSFETDSC